MALSKEDKSRLEDLTVALMLSIRSEFLASGAKALTHWEQLHTRMKRASLTTSSMQRCITKIYEGLRLGAPRSSTCSDIGRLSAAIAEIERGESAWMAMLRTEHAYLIARCRVEAERRKDDRQQTEVLKMSPEQIEQTLGVELDNQQG